MLDPSVMVKIDETNIDRELANHSGNFLHVAHRCAIVENEYEQFKSDLNMFVASVSTELRQEKEEKGVKWTNDSIMDEVRLNPKYQEQIRARYKLREKRDSLLALRDSLRMKKDLLVQLAINKRSELDNLFDGIKQS